MKNFLKITLAVTLLTMFGCSNENSVNPKPELSTATITGVVYADLDETNGDYEKAPAGTRIVAVINSKDLVVSPSNQAYGLRYYEGEVGSNGSYSIDVEVGNRPIEVEILPADFRAQVKTASGEEENIFYGTYAADDIDVYKDGTFILDLYY